MKTSLKLQELINKVKGKLEAENEEEAYTELLTYLSECVIFQDVTAFDFEEE